MRVHALFHAGTHTPVVLLVHLPVPLFGVHHPYHARARTHARTCEVVSRERERERERERQRERERPLNWRDGRPPSQPGSDTISSRARSATQQQARAASPAHQEPAILPARGLRLSLSEHATQPAMGAP